MNINENGIDLDEEVNITVGILHEMIQNGKEEVSENFMITGKSLIIEEIKILRENGFNNIDEILFIIENDKIKNLILKGIFS